MPTRVEGLINDTEKERKSGKKWSKKKKQKINCHVNIKIDIPLPSNTRHRRHRYQMFGVLSFALLASKREIRMILTCFPWSIKKAKQSRHTPWWRLGETRYSSYSFLTSALDGDEWSASRPGRTLPRGKDPRYPLYRRLVGPQSRSGRRG
jgi:hypothetical protein